MNNRDKAYWLADKIPALGDYAKEAAQVLKKQAEEIERLRNILQQVLTDAQAQDVLLEWWHQLECETVPNAKLRGATDD
jgi:D-alanyl-D-alanine dipeptidase